MYAMAKKKLDCPLAASFSERYFRDLCIRSVSSAINTASFSFVEERNGRASSENAASVFALGWFTDLQFKTASVLSEVEVRLIPSAESAATLCYSFYRSSPQDDCGESLVANITDRYRNSIRIEHYTSLPFPITVGFVVSGGTIDLDVVSDVNVCGPEKLCSEIVSRLLSDSHLREREFKIECRFVGTPRHRGALLCVPGIDGASERFASVIDRVGLPAVLIDIHSLPDGANAAEIVHSIGQAVSGTEIPISASLAWSLGAYLTPRIPAISTLENILVDPPSSDSDDSAFGPRTPTAASPNPTVTRRLAQAFPTFNYSGVNLTKSHLLFSRNGNPGRFMARRSDAKGAIRR